MELILKDGLQQICLLEIHIVCHWLIYISLSTLGLNRIQPEYHPLKRVVFKQFSSHYTQTSSAIVVHMVQTSQYAGQLGAQFFNIMAGIPYKPEVYSQQNSSIFSILDLTSIIAYETLLIVEGEKSAVVIVSNMVRKSNERNHISCIS